jgi:hypothetical protein
MIRTVCQKDDIYEVNYYQNGETAFSFKYEKDKKLDYHVEFLRFGNLKRSKPAARQYVRIHLPVYVEPYSERILKILYELGGRHGFTCFKIYYYIPRAVGFKDEDLLVNLYEIPDEYIKSDKVIPMVEHEKIPELGWDYESGWN